MSKKNLNTIERIRASALAKPGKIYTETFEDGNVLTWEGGPVAKLETETAEEFLRYAADMPLPWKVHGIYDVKTDSWFFIRHGENHYFETGIRTSIERTSGSKK
jgi:broad specificity phosphatase PhoE